MVRLTLNIKEKRNGTPTSLFSKTACLWHATFAIVCHLAPALVYTKSRDFSVWRVVGKLVLFYI